MMLLLMSNTSWVTEMQGCQSNSFQTTFLVHTRDVHNLEGQGMHVTWYRLAFCKSPGLVNVDGVVDHMCQEGLIRGQLQCRP